MGTWLGIFPTVETIGAQVAALLFVVGSYFLAEFVRKRQVRKAVEGLEDAATADEPVAANGNGHASTSNGKRPQQLDPDRETAKRS
jgi:high-affinity iron transporter